MSNTTTWVEDVQYGIRFPDGRVDWQVDRWFGQIADPEIRALFGPAHDYAQDSQGLPRETVEFVTRKRRITTTVSETTVISDTIEEPEQPADDDTNDEGSANGTE